MQQGSKLKNIINVLRNRPVDSANFVGAESFATWQPGREFFGHYQSDAYASAYPNIHAIADEYMTIQPYAIDSKGDMVSDNPVVNALYHPNQRDSSVSFAEKIAVSTLALRKTYILVWRREGTAAVPGGEITPANIAGFTFLEFPSVTRRDGKTYYTIGSQEFDDSEVMTLPGGVDPYNLYGGYSPSEAARRWAKLDDYIADYQAGFFENGAVPAGQFLITAPTVKEYNNIVDMLQARHRGAGSNGNVTYAHRPIDPSTGKPTDAQITWVPFAQTNKENGLSDIFTQANQRIDTAFGVAPIIKGQDDSATYANAQVAEKGFAKRAVYPLALRNYTQITHELNRITNGLGVAITFKYQIPKVADEELVEAQTKTAHTTIITELTAAGYSIDSIVDAYELPVTYKLLEKGDDSGNANEDNPDVDEGDEVITSPDPSKIDGVTPLNKGGSKRTNPKAKTSDYDKLYSAAQKYMQGQVDNAIESLSKSDRASNDATNPTKEQQDEFSSEMIAAIVAIMVAKGELQYEEGKALLEEAGISTENLDSFKLSDTAETTYKMYLQKVGASYSDETAEAIRNVLAQADEQGFTLKQTQDALQNIMNTDDWRVTRLATTELNRSGATGSVESMKQIKAETGAEIEKALSHDGNATPPCEFCQSQDDVWHKVDQPIVGYGETVIGVDGGQYVNDFVAIDAGDLHPNGKGHMAYRVVK